MFDYDDDVPHQSYLTAMNKNADDALEKTALLMVKKPVERSCLYDGFASNSWQNRR